MYLENVKIDDRLFISSNQKTNIIENSDTYDMFLNPCDILINFLKSNIRDYTDENVDFYNQYCAIYRKLKKSKKFKKYTDPRMCKELNILSFNCQFFIN